jgi:hypothetical protein
MTLSANSTPARSPGVLAQQLEQTDSTLVLLHPRSGEYFTLEAVGRRVWQLCDGKRTIAEIAASIAEEYEEAPGVITSDVLELVKELMDAELVVAAS